MTVDQIRQKYYEQKGIEKGIEQGREEGRQEGDNLRALKDAENFLKLGVSEEIVAQGTGIPLEEVKKIKMQLVN